jgi:hypothetical protein
MKKVKITFLGLVACLAIYQVIPNKEFVNDVSLLSYQLMALADGEATSGTKVDCYGNISDTFFNAQPYYRCNILVDCAYVEGKNPRNKSSCYTR